MGEPKPLTAYQQTYHWRNKNCAAWSYEWMKTNLARIKVDDGKQNAEIVEVTSVSGDCDLGQRKGKLLTIYDLEVEMKWVGKAGDGTEIKGTLKVPEVSHEAIDGLSDYVFEFKLDDPSSAGESLLPYLRTAFPPLLKERFTSFRPALLAAHGTPDAPPPASGTATPPISTSTPEPEAGSNSVGSKKESAKKNVGTTGTVEVKATLHASAEDIWGLLTDEKRIPMWSRSPAKMSLKVGEPFELFAGNVRGETVEVDVAKKLVQTWQTRSPKWPSDHFGTMTITLVQGSDSTSATFTLEGVPTGQESDVERALDSYYIRGLKQMGLGTYL